MPKFELPPLPYDYAALEPHIDTQTMQIHHDKHHAAYVNNLNAALESHPDLQNKSPEALLRDLNSIPEAIRTAVRNQGGGVVNHTMFWQIMGPKAGGEPTGDLANAIKAAFGNFATFKDQFTKAAMGQFGSGWAWLVLDGSGAMKITALPNQNSPLSEGQSPLLCVDVWEHAYYLKYQNRRADYLNAWWNVVNWAAVAERYAKARK
jgi:Fe-Mn family superoxide dismutase